jgi:probable rRNA maturation factor
MSDYQIEVQNDDEYPINAERLILAVETTLAQQEAVAGCQITIVITDNESVQALNNEFRKVDAPTDILSFPFSGDARFASYLGDLVIAFPYASAQAEREAHPLEDSLMLLVVHGTLHLLGYDHDTPENRQDMWDEQEQALLALGLSPDLVPDLEGTEHDDEGA